MRQKPSERGSIWSINCELHHPSLGGKMVAIQLPEPQQKIIGNRTVPLVLDGEGMSTEDAVAYFTEHQNELSDQLLQHGGVVFRNFGMNSPEDACAVLKVFESAKKYHSMMGGGGPRRFVCGPLQTSTESPPAVHIPMHHEVAYLSSPPSTLIFYCVLPSAEGGETPIAISSDIVARIRTELPELVENIKKHGVIYSRTMADQAHCKRDVQRSWQEAFDTTDRLVAEERAKACGTASVTWNEASGQMLLKSEVFPGIGEDTRRGESEETWYNAIVLLHPAANGYERDEDAPWNVSLGNGEMFRKEDIVAARRIMSENVVAFKWQKGDLFFVDNKIALHSRNPFEPPRQILATMWE